MRDLVRACSPGIDWTAIEDQDLVEAGKLSNIIVDLQNMITKMSVEHVNRLL